MRRYGMETNWCMQQCHRTRWSDYSLANRLAHEGYTGGVGTESKGGWHRVDSPFEKGRGVFAALDGNGHRTSTNNVLISESTANLPYTLMSALYSVLRLDNEPTEAAVDNRQRRPLFNYDVTISVALTHLPDSTFTKNVRPSLWSTRMVSPSFTWPFTLSILTFVLLPSATALTSHVS